ncbi:hypothetical protein [Cellulosimicrobium cellulans]|uniref:hypothetical protein n=1 Tax=Cellulosimicrobium cellulans TaxID=1710 RepID=UPI0008492729|nr:hypothetical protein [Cellulosimicrobium cellulans]
MVTVGCAVLDPTSRTAYCRPDDPVVTPQSVAPGAELNLAVAGDVDGVDCESRMPARARYEVWITSDTSAEDPDDGLYSASLGLLDPGSDGDAEGTVRLPDEVPLGRAEVSVNLVGADTVCDIDPTIGCAKDPFVAIEIVA